MVPPLSTTIDNNNHNNLILNQKLHSGNGEVTPNTLQCENTNTMATLHHSALSTVQNNTPSILSNVLYQSNSLNDFLAFQHHQLQQQQQHHHHHQHQQQQQQNSNLHAQFAQEASQNIQYYVVQSPNGVQTIMLPNQLAELQSQLHAQSLAQAQMQAQLRAQVQAEAEVQAQLQAQSQAHTQTNMQNMLLLQLQQQLQLLQQSHQQPSSW
jgi:hypothetical protein